MCRITGFWDFNTVISYSKIDIIDKMRDTMINGGPDSGNSYVDDIIALGHRRLSIIDLSESANQPMIYDDYILIFNGEIYNFNEIKNELIFKGHKFKTNSDTEVLLKSYIEWGMEAPNKFHGMFAFAIWNKKTSELILCRDRFGVKPLYYYFDDKIFMFSSELKAFYSHPNFKVEIDNTGLPHFIQKGYFHPNDCILQNVSKVKPGHFVKINANKQISITQYWNIEDNYSETTSLSNEAISNDLEQQLINSFKLRMVSDVPVGVFLSGGIDSTLVTTLLTRLKYKNLKTFTIAFDEKEFDESLIAQETSRILNTEHTVLKCTEKDFIECLELMPNIYDEPFGDISSIPTILLCKNTSKYVKVCLSGDGGDELFGGYSKYQYLKQYFVISKIPTSIKYLILKTLKLNFNFLNRYITNLAVKIDKVERSFNAKTLFDFYFDASTYIKKEELSTLINLDLNYIDRYRPINTQTKKSNIISLFGLWDMQSYLLGDILVKVDRASMAFSLECREPFLDQNLIALALKIPDQFKIKRGSGKLILKQILKRNLQSEHINKPKQGFNIPIDKWIKQHLQNELNQLLHDSDFFKQFGFKQSLVSYITTFLNDHNSKNAFVVWHILSLYKWYKVWIQKEK